MKRILSFMCAAVLLLSLASCGTVPAETPTDGQTTGQAYYPITVTDHAGREVVIEDEPMKLVSGYYISTSAVIALDLHDRLVGIEAKAAKRAIYQLSAPQLIELPSVGSAKEFDLEGCAALEPDLVILPLKLKNAADTLSALGIDVLLVNPEDAEGLAEMIEMIASAANCKDKADALLGFIDQQSGDLAALLAGRETPSVYLAGNSDLLSTASSSMYQSEMIRLAGGKNVAGEITDTYWVTVSYEQILTWDPEFIILTSDATYTVEDVLNNPNLKNCRAVENKHVYKLPGDAEAWDSPVPSGILGSVWLASVLHPEKITAADCTTRIDTFYETFYDFTYSQRSQG